MSYARKGLDGSQIYLYATGPFVKPSARAPIICQGCLLQPSGDYLAFSRSSALEHLHEHQHAGHTVPEAALARLEREIDQESA